MQGDFFDTNIILYLTDEDPAFVEVSDRLVRDGGTISTQVLNETVNVLRRSE